MIPTGERRPADLPDGPLRFLNPPFVFAPEAIRKLREGHPVVKILPDETDEIAALAAIRLDAPAEALRVAVLDIERLKRSAEIMAIKKFSTPPVIEDLEDLVLDDQDMEDLRDCRPGDCGMKLAEPEIRALQQAQHLAGADARAAVQEKLRQLVLQRVLRYLRGGLENLPAYHDFENPVELQPVFSSLIGRLPFLYRKLPRFAAFVEHYPELSMPEITSFLYWSKEKIGRRASVNVTHVSIWQGEEPAVIVAAKQIFANHYTDGSLGLTMVLTGPAGSHSYLVYVNRSHVDFLKGFWAPLTRMLIVGRIESDAGRYMEALRNRLESEF
jgi:hypothetical protein